MLLIHLVLGLLAMGATVEVETLQLREEHRLTRGIEALEVRRQEFLSRLREVGPQSAVELHQTKRDRSTDTLCPPNPSELLKAWSICSARPSLGT